MDHARIEIEVRSGERSQLPEAEAAPRGQEDQRPPAHLDSTRQGLHLGDGEHGPLA